MPLARYFLFVGGVLLALLFISDDYLPTAGIIVLGVGVGCATSFGQRHMPIGTMTMRAIVPRMEFVVSLTRGALKQRCRRAVPLGSTSLGQGGPSRNTATCIAAVFYA